MCRIFAGQAVADYQSETRSVRLSGHSTSLRLERAYWEILEDIAATQNVSLAKFLAKLHAEVLEIHGECRNFASLLRCSCLRYVGEVKNNPDAAHDLKLTAATDFAVHPAE
ncbi:MAG: ribbon-helix-helix domain-containing protein [Hyphomicrobiaceae bacterium]